MGRHRHITCVRSDGLSTVLASLLEDRRVVAATLVDLDSGFVLDACSRDPELTDLELLGAGHADLARAAAAVGATWPAFEATMTVETPDDRVHLLREVPDPHGDRLVLAVVVAGTSRAVARTRQKMAAVAVEALTAGPTLQRRPVDGRWQVDPAAPDVPAVTPEGLPGLEPVHPTAGAPRPDGLPGLEPVIPARLPLAEPEPTVADEPAPPAAMVPIVATLARERARWAGETPEPDGPLPDGPFPDGEDPDGEDPDGDDPDDEGPEPPIPAPREEPAGAER